MEMHYHCSTTTRRNDVADFDEVVPNTGLKLNGIDYLEVLDADAPSVDLRQRVINLVFLKPDGVTDNGNAVLAAENFVIKGGSRIKDIQVENVEVGLDANTLKLTLNHYGDYSRYTLWLRENDSSDLPPVNIDPVLSRVDFTFKSECPSDFDCITGDGAEPARQPGPSLDYLAKDYDSFRRLMLDRMAVTIPDWEERSPADLGVTLVEALAYAADYTSYYQDAVATEAYLPLAHLRPSVRRHTRLLGYQMSEGCNARTFIAITASQNSSANGVALRKGTRLLTGADNLTETLDPVLVPDYPVFRKLLNAGSLVFETMEDVKELKTARNEMKFHTWGEKECCLPEGTTSAHLVGTAGELGLKGGDVLIFEEKVPVGGDFSDPADINHRQAVRLSRNPTQITDPLLKITVIEIHWHDEDALRFALNLGDVDNPGAVALGNVVLADHGLTLRYDPDENATEFWGEDNPDLKKKHGLIPYDVPKSGTYNPSLSDANTTYVYPYDQDEAHGKSANSALVTAASKACPAVVLFDASDTWTAGSDLLGSSRFAPEFVVEVGNNGCANLRFGDNQFGKQPTDSTVFHAHIRTGNGTAGNIGADAVQHIITDKPVSSVRNPLPAVGGAAPESLVNAKIYAPRAFRKQLRAVTPEDYTQFAESHPDVQKAVTERRWTGSWHTMFISVDRYGGHKFDEEFEAELREHIGQYRLAGHDMEIEDASYVPLDIELVVCVASGYYASDVEQELLKVFGTGQLRDGTFGYFHPDNFSFSEPVTLSTIVARGMELQGVKWLGLEKNNGEQRGRFRRLYDQSVDYGDTGVIPVGRSEVVRLDNDPNAPEIGRLSFIMEGGNA